MTIQRATFETPTVVSGAVTPTAASVITKCGGATKDVARLYVRLTTAQCSDPLILAWLTDIKNSGFLTPWACTPSGVQSWAQSANHGLADDWFEAAGSMMQTPFVRMVQGLLFDIRPWQLGGGWNQTAKTDYVTLQNALWAKVQTNPSAWNPGGNSQIVMANTFNFNMHDMTVDVAGVPKVIDRLCKGQEQVILVNQYDITNIKNRMHPHLSTAKTVPWNNVTLALTAKAVGQTDVPDAASTLATVGTEAAVNTLLNGLKTHYESTQLEVKIPFLVVDDLNAWDALT